MWPQYESLMLYLQTDDSHLIYSDLLKTIHWKIFIIKACFHFSWTTFQLQNHNKQQHNKLYRCSDYLSLHCHSLNRHNEVGINRYTGGEKQLHEPNKQKINLACNHFLSNQRNVWVVLLTGNCMKTLSLLFKIVKPDIQSKDYSVTTSFWQALLCPTWNPTCIYSLMVTVREIRIWQSHDCCSHPSNLHCGFSQL